MKNWKVIIELFKHADLIYLLKNDQKVAIGGDIQKDIVRALKHYMECSNVIIQRNDDGNGNDGAIDRLRE